MVSELLQILKHGESFLKDTQFKSQGVSLFQTEQSTFRKGLKEPKSGTQIFWHILQDLPKEVSSTQCAASSYPSSSLTDLCRK